MDGGVSKPGECHAGRWGVSDNSFTFPSRAADTSHPPARESVPMKPRLLVLVIASVLLGPVGVAAEKTLVVHEWGTFTSLQDEKGEPIGGINTDDEPVPAFVRRLTAGFLLSP